MMMMITTTTVMVVIIMTTIIIMIIVMWIGVAIPLCSNTKKMQKTGITPLVVSEKVSSQT
jgi:hypothetical protein